MPVGHSIDEEENVDDIITEYERNDLEGNESFEDDTQSGEDMNVQNKDNENEGKLKRRIDPTAKKRVVLNPIPKLNTERLKGPRGIHTIEKYFEGFKYHGKNHERDDLDRIMKRLEHWAYRLFPKLTFDDMIARTEKLGAKKDLQTFIKKYRLGMLTIDSDLTIEDNIDSPTEGEITSTDTFDLIIAQQIDRKMQSVVSSSQHKEHDEFHDTSTAISLSNTPSENLVLNVNDERNSADPKEASSILSDEIKEKIERNRQLAIQRRLERLKAINAEKDQME